jgi:hypothetical protein
MNGIIIDPGPVLGEPIFYGCLYLLVWIPSSSIFFCPLGAHRIKSSVCADVNIWSGNEREGLAGEMGEGSER